MGIPSTHTSIASLQPKIASRRHWLKGLGALLGTGLLAAPTTLLAGTAPAAVPSPASDLVGGEEYIGMVKLLAGSLIPEGWALCDGRELPAAQHPALFALLGTTYGGNGRSTFALPDVSESLTPQNAPTLPGCLIAIKVANAPATAASAGVEMRLRHHYRPRTARRA